MIEYRVVNCLGHLNMAKAIEDVMNKNEGWRVHSFVASDVEDHQIGMDLKLDVQVMRVTRFIVLFEKRDTKDVPRMRLLEKPTE